MRVFVFGTRGFPDIQGGVEKHCECLYPLLPADYQVTIFRRKEYVNSSARYPGIRFIDFYSTRIKGFEAFFHSMLCTFACIVYRPDVVHIHNIGPGFFTPLLRLCGLKTVLTYHSANYEHRKWNCLFKAFLRYAESVSFRYSNRIIFVNACQLERQSGKVKQKSVYIPNGIVRRKKPVDSGYISSLGLSDGKYMLAVGRITPEKGFQDLIEAFLLLHTQEMRLVIAGGVEAEKSFFGELKKKANEQIFFTGALPEEKLNELYVHTKLFVLSSHHEGFPLVLLEAMQMGADVLVSDIPGIRMLPLNDDDFFRKGDVTDLADKINRKLSGTCSKRTYDLSDYEWKAIAEEFVSCLIME